MNKESISNRKISITLTEEELLMIDQRADTCNMKRSAYIKTAVFQGEIINYKPVTILMEAVCKFYAFVNCIEDKSIREELKSEVHELWLSLK